MSIIHSYKENSQPLIRVSDAYEKSNIQFTAFIFTFSWRIIEVLLEDHIIELVSENNIRSISCNYPVYRFINTNIGIIKTTVGAPITSALIEEVCYLYSCHKIVMFGTCGTLDKSISKNKIIVPTDAYRDEGTSYHYMAPSDYIKIKNYKIVCEILNEINIDYVCGKTWTTDAFYRETLEEMNQRKQEGCIAVEMEVSACQAVCNYNHIEFYNFLYRADNLDSSSWEKGQRDSNLSKDSRLNILNIAFEIAKRISNL